MKKRFRTMLKLVLALVFLVSTALALGQFLSDRQAAGSYDRALSLAQSGASAKLPATQPPLPAESRWVVAPVEEEDPHMEELAALDLSALRQVNPDVIGWIRIPGTKIDYPFLQGQDNEHYLHHTWEGEKNAAGAIFLECQNSADLTDFNTILYGHNMNSGAMFANLRKYTSRNFWEQHPYIYLLTDQGVWRYEVFSSYKAPIDGYTYGLNIRQDKTKAYLISNALRESEINTGLEPALTDRVLTLSTCSGDGYDNRWVVHARLKMVEVTE